MEGRINRVSLHSQGCGAGAPARVRSRSGDATATPDASATTTQFIGPGSRAVLDRTLVAGGCQEAGQGDVDQMYGQPRTKNAAGPH